MTKEIEDMTEIELTDHLKFLRNRIAFFEGEINTLPTGVRSSGAGQDEREHYGRMIKSHRAQIDELIWQMADICVDNYKQMYNVEDVHMQLCLHKHGDE